VTFLKSPDTNEPGNFNVLNKFLEGVYGQWKQLRWIRYQVSES
jgi:hypothetical protein